MESSIGFVLAGILAAGVVCQWVAWRIKIPAILPLLLLGLLLGPILGWLHPRELLGDLFFPLVSIAVSIILFEGALTLKWDDIRHAAGTVRNLLTVGALVTWFGGALAARFFMGLSWSMALLFGALIIVTGPTVINPLLRNVRPTARIGSILHWEGILIDPIGASVAVLVFEAIIAGVDGGLQHSLLLFLWIALVGIATGLAAGFLTYWPLRRYWVPDFLREIFVLAMVIGVFVLANALAPEAGLTAVTAMGIVLANTQLHKLREVLYFKETLTVLLISSLFILLAADVNLEGLALLGGGALTVLAVVMFVLRPLGVHLSAIGGGLSRNERLFLSWIAPRGIVAASTSSFFAFALVEQGYAEARVLAPLVFLVIIGTVLVQSLTAKPWARRLGVSEAAPQGFLLVGANRFARELALLLQDNGFLVRLVDTNFDQVVQARLEGLDVVQGNVLSSYIEDDLDLSGIGHLLALTDNDEANALACRHFEDEFGSAGVFQLPPQLRGRADEAPNRTALGRLLFASTATCQNIAGRLQAGESLRATPLTDKFTWEDFRRRNDEATLLLMAVRKERAVVATVGAPVSPQPGWTAISLGPAENRKAVTAETPAAEDQER